MSPANRDNIEEPGTYRNMMGTPSAEDHRSTPSGGPRLTVAADGPPLRIILVGRTGLDAKLRLDAGVELVRVKSPLEAVGELSDPIDGDSPTRAVVIVAPDADPARRPDGQGGMVEDGVRAVEFVAALRHLDPQVRVLRLEAGDGSAPARGGYDGVINANASAGVLRAVVRGLRTQASEGDAEGAEAGEAKSEEQMAAPVVVEPVKPEAVRAPESRSPEARPDAREAEPEPADEAPTVEVPGAQRRDDVASLIDTMLASKKPGAADVGDEALVRQLLRGADITDTAVEVIRKRIDGKDVAFLAPGPDGRAAAAGAGMNEASVGWRGRLLGRLISKDLSPEQLAPHAAWLAAWLAMRDQHSHLRDAAFTDPLTGANNRRFFEHFMGVALEQALRQRQSLTVLMFDIDDFKVFNDTYGHAAGDEILTETVRLLKKLIRPSDKVCRMGGDEFVVIFHEPTGPRDPASKPPTTVAQVARRFQDAIAAHQFPKLGRDAPATLTISGGLATFPWDGRSAAELVARADELALQSKRTGKNCITFGPGAEREWGSEG